MCQQFIPHPPIQSAPQNSLIVNGGALSIPLIHLSEILEQAGNLVRVAVFRPGAGAESTTSAAAGIAGCCASASAAAAVPTSSAAAAAGTGSSAAVLLRELASTGSPSAVATGRRLPMALGCSEGWKVIMSYMIMQHARDQPEEARGTPPKGTSGHRRRR